MENHDNIYFAMKYSWGLKIPQLLYPPPVMTCLNCDEELDSVRAIFCCQGCSDALQFKLDVGMLE